jgi:tRNA-modifying protein YgfZ
MAAPADDRRFFDLSTRVKLHVSGADRLRFLNGQVTNDVRKATKENSIEACVLNTKGKMDAHVFVHLDGDSFALDADPALRSSLQTRLERYIIADDVQIEDVTEQLSIFHLLGPAPSNLSSGARIVSVDRFGETGSDVWVAANKHNEVAAELIHEFKFCDDDCAGVFRIERGIPRWGRELTNEIIPVEANLEQRCIDYEKGCYIGQEVISRMKMSGQRNKQLMGLRSLTQTQLREGMRLIGPEGKDVGWITSASRTVDGEVALGYVKRGFNSPGSKIEGVSSDGISVSVEVVDLPFVRSVDV